MNHFLLPGEVKPGQALFGAASLYGMYAIDVLVNELMKLGTERKRLRAKVFGGAAMLTFSGSGPSSVSESNIAFAFEYLNKEGIPVLASDVGGRVARKIWLFPETGQVLLRRLGMALNLPLSRREGRYRHALAQHEGETKAVLFNREKEP